LQFCPSSNYERELHEIASDPRFKLLTVKERKQVFEEYKKEPTEKIDEVRKSYDDFRRLMEEAGLHGK
jgi:transcription elongation regulator 1